MVQIEGTYHHEHSENLDEYFKALGVPYIPRKMMCLTNPTIQIFQSEDGKWTFITATTFRTSRYTFNLGEEYEETMPGNTMKCTTTFEDDKFTTICVGPNGKQITRIYTFSEDGLILIYRDKDSQVEAKRFYKRN